MNANNPRTLIAIPTYNESQNLETIVTEVLAAAPAVHLLIVDDNSPDGTGQIADRLSGAQERVEVLHRQTKEGLGPAYLAAFAWADRHGYDWVGEFDADGSHRPQDLPRLLKMAATNRRPDLVIGSRWTPGGATSGWSRRRQLLSRAGSRYVNAVLRLGVADTTAGFRLYRVNFLRRLLANFEITSRGYGFQIEMTWRTKRAGGRIIEVPITFTERRGGTSKMSGSIIREAFISVLKWRGKELLKLH